MVVVAAVILRDGRILVCQRSRKDTFPLKWEFPGGKVRAGEEPKNALVRELREELGVSARIGNEIFRARHKYSEMRDTVELIFYQAHLANATLENLIFETIEWVEPAALRSKDFLEADLGLVERLASGNGLNLSD